MALVEIGRGVQRLDSTGYKSRVLPAQMNEPPAAPQERNKSSGGGLFRPAGSLVPSTIDSLENSDQAIGLQQDRQNQLGGNWSLQRLEVANYGFSLRITDKADQLTLCPGLNCSARDACATTDTACVRPYLQTSVH